MATLFGMGTIEQQANQWGLWARGGLGAIACRASSGVSADITDEQGVMFDSVVLSLQAFDRRAFKVVKRHYIGHASLAEIAVELKCSRALVNTIHKNALHYLAGAMIVSYRTGAFCDLSNMTYEADDCLPDKNVALSRQ